MTRVGLGFAELSPRLRVVQTSCLRFLEFVMNYHRDVQYGLNVDPMLVLMLAEADDEDDGVELREQLDHDIRLAQQAERYEMLRSASQSQSQSV